MAQAQVEPLINLDVWERAQVFYSPGFAFLDTSPLNQPLGVEGFSPYSGTFISQGGGALINFNGIVIGGSGYGLTGFRSANSAGDTLYVEGRYGLFHLGYEIFSENGFHVYPLLGIGSGSVSVTSSQPLGGIFGFQNAPDATRMDSSQVVLDLALAADYLIDFNANPELATGLLVGLKLGYLFVPSPPQWEANRQVLGGSLPNLNVGGLYVQLMLGAGAGRKETPRRQPNSWEDK